MKMSENTWKYNTADGQNTMPLNWHCSYHINASSIPQTQKWANKSFGLIIQGYLHRTDHLNVAGVWMYL